MEITNNIINSLISILKDEYSKLSELNKYSNNELHKGEDYPVYSLQYANPEEFYLDMN